LRIGKSQNHNLGASILIRYAGEIINDITLPVVANLSSKTMQNAHSPFCTQGEAIWYLVDASNVVPL
jgi:pyruvate/2-oxoglutarate dehydrogenase complex dihydrolipoamide dehydrogenase (E3) component